MGGIQNIVLSINNSNKKTVLMDTHVDRFYGVASDYERFANRVRAVWWETGGEREDRLQVVKCAVSDSVMGEIACMPQEIQEDPERLLQEIGRRFGDQRSPTELLRLLLSTTQQPGESVRVYSQRLRALFNKLQGREAALGIPPRDEGILRDVLGDGLRDETLKRSLRQRLSDSPAMSFQDVRDFALRWEGTVDEVQARASAATAPLPPRHEAGLSPSPYTPAPTAPPHNTGPSSQSQPQGDQNAALLAGFKTMLDGVMKDNRKELKEVKGEVRGLREQFDRLDRRTKALEQERRQPSPQGPPPRRHPPQQQRQQQQYPPQQQRQQQQYPQRPFQQQQRQGGSTDDCWKCGGRHLANDCQRQQRGAGNGWPRR